MKLTLLDVVLRLLTAMFISLVVGLERERTHRPAGLRTHMLVSLGACIAMITGVMIWYEYSYGLGGTFDVNRLGAQVVSGVGFLGAGTIIREGNAIKGLTTAASVWACACMGLTAGAGYYMLALVCAACVFITLTLFETVQHKMGLFEHENEYAEVEVRCTDLKNGMDALVRVAGRYHAAVHDIAYFPENDEYRLCFKARFKTTQAAVRREWFLTELLANPYIFPLQKETAGKAK